MKKSKILTLTAAGLVVSVLSACHRGDSSLKAGKTTPAKPGAAGAATVEGAVFVPKKISQKNMAPPDARAANIITGDEASGLNTVLMSFSCTENAVAAIKFRKEPIFRIEPGSHLIARQNSFETSPDVKDTKPEKLVSFACKPQVASEEEPTDSGTKSNGRRRARSMMNHALETAVNEDEVIYDRELSGSPVIGDATAVPAQAAQGAAAQPAAPAPDAGSAAPALPANIKAVAMKSEGRLTLSVYFSKDQPAPLSLKVLCVDREKMASAEAIFEPKDKATAIPDLLFATGTKALIQTKLKDATEAQYQVVTCEKEPTK